MMQKAALVVDDSKSARVVLRRMLERHGMTVQAVESAPAALEYLIHHRPDVIFMDHMMPDMDGFQAVTAIKNNPDTATIPVLMYTSKEGDLYVGQARALGAVGVLPKTVAPAELFEVLKRLGLAEDRRTAEAPPAEPGTASERAADRRRHIDPDSVPARFGSDNHPPSQSNEALDVLLHKSLETQRSALRNDMLLSMETVADQTGKRLNRELDEKLAIIRAADLQERRNQWISMLLLALLLLVSVGWNIAQQLGNNRTPVVQAKSPPETTAIPAGPVAAAAVTDTQPADDAVSPLSASALETLEWAMNQTLQYDYSEIALDNQRIDIVQTLLARLAGENFKGRLILQTHVGEFCMLGNPTDGLRLPPPALTVDKCEFIGNPVQPADTPASQQSLAFINFLDSTPLLGEDGITLEIETIPRTTALVPYPNRTAEVSAGDWNVIAALNNRVILQIRPLSSPE